MSLGRWIAGAARLRPREIGRRIAMLVANLPRSVAEIVALKKQAVAAGKNLRVVILTERLGDIIAAGSAVRSLKRSDEFLAWLVRPRFLAAVQANLDVDRAVAVSSYTETIILRWLFSRVQFTNLHIDGNYCNIFSIKCRNPNPCGINVSNYYKNRRSLADVFSLIATGGPAVCLPPLWAKGPFLPQMFEDPTRPLVAIHFTSDEPARSWDPTKIEPFVRALLHAVPVNILELGLSPSLCDGPNIVTLRDQLPLPQQFAALGSAVLYIGVDSGFSHVANASAVRCIFLLGHFNGYSDYVPWRLRERDTVIRATGQVREVEIEHVIQTAVAVLNMLDVRQDAERTA